VIKKAEIDGIRWRTAKQLYAIYLERCQLDDGGSAADVIAARLRERALEQKRFESLGVTETHYAMFQNALQDLDRSIENLQRTVHKIMHNEGSTGHWLAIGRRGPDLAHELIPARYWPFFIIDVENGSAVGRDIEFRDLHCAMTAGIPSAHPLLASFRAANELKPADKAAGVIESNIQEANLGRNGAPGRPSWMHLVEAEFKRRRNAGRLEPFLTREAAALAAWFRVAYPEVPPLTAKSISNKLRGLYRAALSDCPKL
jgi:hypothetical protein